MKMRFSVLLLAVAAALPVAHAQEWPARPVRIVVAFPPGGFTDVIARMFSVRLSEESGQPFIVDNRPGAGGTIGTEFVVNSKPDGYTTILLPSSFSTNAALYKPPYDPINGIAAVSLIATMPYVLVVHPAVKANNLKELIELARAKPGTLNYGSAGVGTDLHLALELFRQLSGTDMVHVAYKGIAPALNDLLGGTIQLMFSTPLSVAPHLRAGKLRAIAVSSEQRSSATPDLPSIGELVPGYAPKFWFGMGATTGTPKETILKLNQALGRILEQPGVQERLRAGGVDPTHSTPEEFSRIIAQDVAMWSKVIKTGNIKPD